MVNSKIILVTFFLLVGCQITKKRIKTNFFPQNSFFKKKCLTSNFLMKNNLWKYIANEIKIKIPKNKNIKNQTKIYLSKKKYLKKIMIRSEPYLYLIVKKIKKLNLPIELTLIPIVESGFNPYAISKAKATGIWQIIPITAQLHGLKKNKWIDERRDFIKSTKVALKLFNRLNILFKKNWILTFAAYNCGENRVLNAIKNNKKLNVFNNFWSLNVPKETINYVTKILSLIDILKNNKKYLFNLPIINKKNSLTQINIKKKITLLEVSKFSNLPIKLIKYYNSNLNCNSTDPNGPYKIKIPINKVKIFKKNLKKEKKFQHN